MRESRAGTMTATTGSAESCAGRQAHWGIKRAAAFDLPDRNLNGGGRGIRTPGTLAGTTVFKTAGFNRSPIPPDNSIVRRMCDPAHRRWIVGRAASPGLHCSFPRPWPAGSGLRQLCACLRETLSRIHEMPENVEAQVSTGDFYSLRPGTMLAALPIGPRDPARFAPAGGAPRCFAEP